MPKTMQKLRRYQIMKTPPTNSICSVDPIVAQVIELPSHIPICQMLWPTDERTEKETFANAEFIADAFTVFHETGLTSREILAQRDELLKTLAQCDPGEEWELPETLHGGSVACEISVRDLRAIRAVIAKVGTTPEPVTPA